MTSVADLRTGSVRQIAHVLFIEGVATAWTDDTSGDLIGSGAASWIGLSEADLVTAGDITEQTGEREIKDGLNLPPTITMPSYDPRTGWLSTSPLRVELLDRDGTMAALFATAGKGGDRLAQHIPAGTTALGTSINVGDPLAPTTINPRGKYIGIERIGPAGQRAFFPPWPNFGSPGPEHFWNRAIAADGSFSLVTDDPAVWAGRRWALYRLHKDIHSTATGANAWPVWRLQHEGGGLVAWGVLRGEGRVVGSRMWALSLHGPMGLLKKRIGLRTNIEPGPDTGEFGPPITANLNLSDEEKGFAIWLYAAVFDLGTKQPDILSFGDTGYQANVLTGQDRSALATEIAGLLADVADGTSAYIASYPDGPIESPTNAQHRSANVKFESDEVGIHVIDDGSYPGEYKMDIWLHEKVWRTLGWDLDAQHRWPQSVKETWFDISVARGEDVFGFPEGYARVTFTSKKLQSTLPSYTDDDMNNFEWRIYKPLYDGDVHVLQLKGGSEIHPGSGFEVDRWYCQGTPAIPFEDEKIGGSSVNRAGLFAFRGKIRVGEQVDEVTQVAICEWRNASTAAGTGDDGMIDSTDSDGRITMRIQRWLDPRGYGFDSDKLTTDWSFSTTANPIQIRPIAAISYMGGDVLEYVDAAIMEILCSTGTGTGYEDPLGTLPQPKVTAGVNSPANATGPLFWHGDLLPASMGLAIPKSLLGSASELRSAVYGSGTMNRGRVSWFGYKDAEKLIRNMTEARRIGWRLHGRKYGWQAMGEFTGNPDVALVEDDLGGEVERPQSVIPQQELRASAPIDAIAVDYASGVGGETTLTWEVQALDPDAQHRDGKAEVRLNAPELPADGFWQQPARELWAREAATFHAQAHFRVDGLPVKMAKGQDIYPGTRVTLTNAWVIDAYGNEGVTAHRGVVLRATHALTSGRSSHMVDVLLFERGGQVSNVACYGPACRVAGYDSATRTIYVDPDFRKIQDADPGWADGDDLVGFAEPAWSPNGGTTYVQAWYWDGEMDAKGRPKMQRGPIAPVSSVDESARTITLSADWSTYTGPAGSTSTLYRHFDWILTLTNRDHANTPQWVKDLFGFYVLPGTLQTAGGAQAKDWQP